MTTLSPARRTWLRRGVVALAVLAVLAAGFTALSPQPVGAEGQRTRYGPFDDGCYAAMDPQANVYVVKQCPLQDGTWTLEFAIANQWIEVGRGPFSDGCYYRADPSGQGYTSRLCLQSDARYAAFIPGTNGDWVQTSYWWFDAVGGLIMTGLDGVSIGMATDGRFLIFDAAGNVISDSGVATSTDDPFASCVTADNLWGRGCVGGGGRSGSGSGGAGSGGSTSFGYCMILASDSVDWNDNHRSDTSEVMDECSRREGN